MICIHKENNGNECGKLTCYDSDFCIEHIDSKQNACLQVLKIKIVDTYDKTKKTMVKQKVHILCNKMRRAGSTLCPHHLLLEYEKQREKREGKTTAERLGGYRI
jgi:hypothetical protein